MTKRKRQRSESFQGEQGGDDDARKRLAAFHARMFELPQEEAAAAAPETPRVLFKAKTKEHKKAFADDGEPVPMVKFHNSVKKEKKHTEKKKVAAVQEKATTGLSVVKVSSFGGKKKKKEKREKKKKTAVAIISVAVEKKKVKLDKKKPATVVQSVKKTAKVKVQTVQHSDQGQEEDDGLDPLEQALGKINKEIAMQQVAKPPQKKQKSATGKAVAVPKKEKTKKHVGSPETKNDAQHPATESNDGNAPHANLSKRQRKAMSKKLKQLRERAASDTSDSLAASTKETKNTSPAITSKNAGADSTKSDDTPSRKPDVPSSNSPGSNQKRNKSPKARGLNSVYPKTHASTQPRQEKPLIVSNEPESQTISKEKSASLAPAVFSKAVKTATAKMCKGIAKSAGAVEQEEKVPASSKQLTPIAASLADDTKKKNDMFVSAQESPRQPQVAPKQVRKTVVAPKRAQKTVVASVIQLTDKSSSDSDGGGDLDFERNDGSKSTLFSRLIDSAARERWELVEVGRLVRLFAVEWNFKASKTARFLCETCPELVSVDFLEGMGINLSAEQLVQVFEAGSGNSGVLMNKMASAVENGHLSVRDPAFVSSLERRVSLMETNGEVMELLHPLLESLSTVRDVGCLLKQLCEHWQLERKIALVQPVLLSNVFDDLDGNQDEILIDLPDLTGRLDFPSRLDQEDVDENGNLKGFLANDDSEFSGEEGSEEELDEDDSEVENDPYEGESDSDEEIEITGRSRGRNQFIEDEADVGEDDEEEEEEGEERHSDEESSSDSD